MVHHNVVQQSDLDTVGRLTHTSLQRYCWVCFGRTF